MGYASWRECVVAEFKDQQRYLYYQLEAAQVEKNICTKVQNEPIPETHLRPLTKLRDNPEAQKEAWQRAVETMTARFACALILATIAGLLWIARAWWAWRLVIPSGRVFSSSAAFTTCPPPTSCDLRPIFPAVCRTSSALGSNAPIFSSISSNHSPASCPSRNGPHICPTRDDRHQRR